MKKYLVSVDYLAVLPLAYNDLAAMAFDAKTEDQYADYLKYVLQKAKAVCGEKLEGVEFGIHSTGCIVPFGEGSEHPYTKNFFKEVMLQLPDDIQKAR